MRLNGESASTCLSLSGRGFWSVRFSPSTSPSFQALSSETCLSSILGSRKCTAVQTRVSLRHGDRYVEHLRNFSEGAENLDSPETSSPLLPSTLDRNSGFVTQKFASSTTSPAVIFSFDRHTAYELLLSLAFSLRRGFSISANPEVILARELAAASEREKDPGKVKTIILAGASNLGSLKPVFQAHGATVIDLTKQGWMITDQNLVPQCVKGLLPR
jgi:hypothetical protein